MAMPHTFRKSRRYNSRRGCPPGYHKRASYTVKRTDRYVPTRCVRATTKYAESQRQFKQRLSRRATQRLARSPAAVEAAQKSEVTCPEGMIMRKGYVRHFRNTVRREGYQQVRSGKVIRVKPIARDIYVKPGCIKNRGKLGRGVEAGESPIGPLRQGELKKHGYSTDLPVVERHEALNKAMREFGALGVFRKLDAVAKLTKRTAPEASRKFTADRDWVRQYQDLKAF